MAPVDGYWGEVTSTLDWCEENYAVTHYVAEFWNTISNVLFIIPPIAIILLNLQHHLEKQILACFVTIAVVGIGSWCFHMTLLYSMQLLDELPMLYGSACLVYAFIEVEKPRHRPNRPLQIFLVLYCVVTTWIYLFYKDPLFHEAAYAIMVFMTVAACTKTVYFNKDKVNVSIAVLACVTYLSGFILWNIDNNFCPQLTELRKTVSVPFLTELHAWWHILAGLGTYLSLIFVMDTRYRLVKIQGKRPQTKYWMSVFPYEILVSSP